MVLIKIEAYFTKKIYKRRDTNFFRFLALQVFLTIWPLKKEGADKPPPISKRVNQRYVRIIDKWRGQKETGELFTASTATVCSSCQANFWQLLANLDNFATMAAFTKPSKSGTRQFSRDFSVPSALWGSQTASTNPMQRPAIMPSSLSCVNLTYFERK